jgi:Pyridine nucleotide-disulphide oxidoreductase, dimerisation domain
LTGLRERRVPHGDKTVRRGDDRQTDLIGGAHIVGHGGEERIHLFAFAMRHAVTDSGMKRATYAFPTFSADMRSMLQARRAHEKPAPGIPAQCIAKSFLANSPENCAVSRGKQESGKWPSG